MKTSGKRVYIDDYEHPDVIKYHQKVFLPGVKLPEWQVRQNDSLSLEIVRQKFNPGEREIVAYFHNGYCLHANDEARSLWSVFSIGSYIKN